MFSTALIPLAETLFAKAEYENPTGSVKDRAARYLLEDARQKGLVTPGSTVIEATSGNMGISLAALCRVLGYRCIIVMPDSMSKERQQRIAAEGAEVVLTPGALGMTGAEEKAHALAQAIPGSFLPRQFENPANALAHYHTTGPEIWAQSAGKVDLFLTGVGTGGTLTGTARFLKEKNPDIRIVAVEPAGSPLLSTGKAGSHGIQGIGANFIPKVLDRTLLDSVCTVTDADAFATAKALGEAGFPVGISAGANVWAAQRLAEAHPDLCIVTILPDSADRYTSLGL